MSTTLQSACKQRDLENEEDIVKIMIKYINKSPSPFHAVFNTKELLKSAGFVHLSENKSIDLRLNKRFIITKNHSALFAVAIGGKFEDGNGFSIIGVHTDSPCLRIKPISIKENVGYLQMGVETYGGGIWHTWLNRDLKVAGRVLVRQEDGTIHHRLVHINRPILTIPSLAEHLNDSNDDFQLNKEYHLTPILCTTTVDHGLLQLNHQNYAPLATPPNQTDMHHTGFLQTIAAELDCDVASIVDFDLHLADNQAAEVGGLHQEFIFTSRLDNQFNCFTACHALIQSLVTLENDTHARILCMYDNEEVGSESTQGAMSQITELLLRRLAPQHYAEACSKSFLISADQAHAVHPNYPEAHEENNCPSLHKGMVVKTNNSQKYSTTSTTRAIIQEIANLAKVPLQHYVPRQDKACGTTIGPILSSKLGIACVDVGGPMLSMHSCREMCCTSSVRQAIKLYSAFFTHLPTFCHLIADQTND